MKAVFVDKDGTLIVDVPYNADPAKVTLYPDAIRSMWLLQSAGFKIFVVSNQSGIAKKYFSDYELLRLFESLTHTFDAANVLIDGFYYCPHQASDGCSCRKPKPGLLLQAAEEHHLDLRASWMIGDILNDVEAGNAAGCKSILINNGNETEWDLTGMRQPLATVPNLEEATKVIIKNDQQVYASMERI